MINKLCGGSSKLGKKTKLLAWNNNEFMKAGKRAAGLFTFMFH